jgi:hypothetical protein
MNKRQFLYMVLSFVTTIMLVLVTAVVLLLLEKPEVKIDMTKGTEVSVKSRAAPKGKWEGKGDLARKLVQRLEVPDPAALAEKKSKKKKKKKKQDEEEAPKISIAKLVQTGFLSDRFKLGNMQAGKWEASFLKDSYYFVSFNHSDGLVNLGPTWLVDVRKKKVLAKNIMARVMMAPGMTATASIFERERQVIGSIANHSFQGGVKLGGVMLIHFSNLTSQKTTPTGDKAPAGEGEDENDQIIGWTVVHDYGNTYRAYFQWVEAGEPTYADFEFNLAKKELRSRNLQAANLMNLGSNFRSMARARILPETYNPEARNTKDRWTGDSRENCRQKENRKRCNAMASLLEDRSLIEAVEWLLTVQADGSFEVCKQKRRCKWSVNEKAGVFEISYIYDLDERKGEQRVSWNVDVRSKTIIPKDKISKMAFLSVHPRPKEMAP